jgi:hypothetical protein
MTMAGGRAGGPGPPVAEIDVPADWHRSPLDGPLVLLARPRHHDGPLCPTVVVATTREPELFPLDRYVEAQLAAAYATLGGYLLHIETAQEPPRLDLALAIEQLGTDLTVVQRHLLHPDGWSVVATGTAADVDWLGVAPLVLGALRSLRLVQR